MLECLLVFGILEDSLRNHCELPHTVVEHVRVSIDQGSRIHAPLKLGVDMGCAEVDAVRRKRQCVIVAKLRLTTEGDARNDCESSDEQIALSERILRNSPSFAPFPLIPPNSTVDQTSREEATLTYSCDSSGGPLVNFPLNTSFRSLSSGKSSAF